MRHDPRAAGVLEDVRRALRPAGRARSGSFAIEGFRLHERALRAGQRVERAVAAESLRDERSERVRSLFAELCRAGCDLHFVPDERLDELTGGRSIGALLGLCALPVPPGLDEILAPSGRRALVLVAAGVEDPGNVGALVRTALASGASGFAAVGVSDPYHPRAVRTSMGSLFKMPILRFGQAEPLLEALARRGAASIGAVSSGGVAPWLAPVGSAAVALWFGSEACGLPESARLGMDTLVTVPMEPGVDSFSVNAAAAMLLYELRRPRAEGGA